MKKNNLPCIVSIAGTDPSGGAGIQADIKSISATGGYAATIITALVAQNTQGIESIYPIPPDFVMKQIDAVFNDIKIDAVKIGMLYNRDIIEIVLAAIKNYQPKNIVLDPVIIAKDGSSLFNISDLNFLKKELFPYVDMITPNLFEAENILNERINSLSDMEKSAKKIVAKYQTSALIKGGHFKGNESPDVLCSIDDGSITWFPSKRIHTKNTHGTGCTLSSAIASFLAQNFKLIDAVDLAKSYLTHAIHAGSNFQIGKGHGPVDHFYFLRTLKNDLIK